MANELFHYIALYPATFRGNPSCTAHDLTPALTRTDGNESQMEEEASLTFYLRCLIDTFLISNLSPSTLTATIYLALSAIPVLSFLQIASIRNGLPCTVFIKYFAMNHFFFNS